MPNFVILVKSDKYGGVCLACLDRNGKWVRPIKPGGFKEEDIIMDNGEMIEIFDVVETEFGPPCPIKHHVENVKFNENSPFKFKRKMDVEEQKSLFKQIADTQLLKEVTSKYEVYDEVIKRGASLLLTGPIYSFEIENIGKHPKIWIDGKNDSKYNVRCTDLRFCEFVNTNSIFLECSDDIDSLKGKPSYFVIGLTGDHLDENGNIEDGKFPKNGGEIDPRYWPMFVSLITFPDYFEED